MVVHMKKFVVLLAFFLLCISLVACDVDKSVRKDEDSKPNITIAPTEESTEPSTNPTEPLPTQPTEPKPSDPTLPDEGQDPGGFGPIF